MRSRRWALPFGDRADAPYMRRLQYLPPVRSCQLRTTPHYRLLRHVYTFLSYHGQADNSRSWFSVLVTRASCEPARSCCPSQVIASRVSYVVLRSAPPYGAFSRLSLRSSQF